MRYGKSMREAICEMICGKEIFMERNLSKEGLIFHIGEESEKRPDRILSKSAESET